MRLGGKVDNSVYAALGYQRFEAFVIADIHLHEAVVRKALQIGKVLAPTGVGKFVKIDDMVLRILGCQQTDHMTAYKPGSSGDQYIAFGHNGLSLWIGKYDAGIGQSAPILIFGRHNVLNVRKLQFKRGIENVYASLGLRVIELIAFVPEQRRIAQGQIAVGKALGNKELTVIVFRQFGADMLSVARGTDSHIHCIIHNSPLHTGNYLGLRIRRSLEMQPPEHTLAGLALIILDKDDGMTVAGERYFPVEIPLRK